MATFEMGNKTATVRIHDEFCSKAGDCSVQNINRVVADYCKRKALNIRQNNITSADMTNCSAEFKMKD